MSFAEGPSTFVSPKIEACHFQAALQRIKPSVRPKVSKPGRTSPSCVPPGSMIALVSICLVHDEAAGPNLDMLVFS